MKSTRSPIICGVLILMALLAPRFGLRADIGDTTAPSEKKRSFSQIYGGASTWREGSQIKRDDGQVFRINSLNTVVRIGRKEYFKGAKSFLRFGALLGNSENGSASSDFSYFQRQASLFGVDFGYGQILFRQPGVELNWSVGGLYREIQHTLPSSDYRFVTQKRILPQVHLEAALRVTPSLYWVQGLGSQGLGSDINWFLSLALDL